MALHQKAIAADLVKFRGDTDKFEEWLFNLNMKLCTDWAYFNYVYASEEDIVIYIVSHTEGAV